ncbi:MAG: ATP-dependent DNA helicase [Candidatus Diapherotrites archaeon]|nr:ATP-dependent DNA helicase [Candidatus Diapherotrites archaeon]
MDYYFSHTKLRDHQAQMADDVWGCVNEGKHLLALAPTGIGKTAAALGPAVSYALKEGKTVFFLTPKISQHEIAVKELKALAKLNKLEFTGVDVVGRKYSCVDPSLTDADFYSFYEVCKKRRKLEKCPYYANAVGFNPAQKARAHAYFRSFMNGYDTIKTNREVLKESSSHNPPLCAYEMLLKTAKRSHVVVCDYFHLLSPYVGKTFISKIGKELKDSVVIIDEAQNVAERIMKSLSFQLTPFTLKRAIKESKLVKSDSVKLVEKLDRQLMRILRSKGERLVEKNELLVPPNEEISELKETGIAYLDATNRTRSSCLSVVKFLEEWKKDKKEYVRVLGRNGVKYTCLDPSIATGPVIEEAHSVIAMSGTLTPMDMYRDILGFPKDTILKEYQSPFPANNKSTLICDLATTKYSRRGELEYRKIASLLEGIIKETPGNSAVFFPSYKVMTGVLLFLKSDKPILMQKENSTPKENAELMKRFRGMRKSGSVLCGVSGGSFAEGMDYPGRDLLCVVVVGIPLKEWNLETQALIDYYDYKYGMGWDYGYLYPAMSKAIQAAGRLIRSEDDRGVVVFLDERFAWKNYIKCFPGDNKPLKVGDPAPHIREFFSS